MSLCPKIQQNGLLFNSRIFTNRLYRSFTENEGLQKKTEIRKDFTCSTNNSTQLYISYRYQKAKDSTEQMIVVPRYEPVYVELIITISIFLTDIRRLKILLNK